MTSVPAHLERHLGEIDGGWDVDADGEAMPFQIARFARGPAPGTISFATLGLSHRAMLSPASGRTVHQELVMFASDSLRKGPLPSILQQVGLDLLAASKPLLRGDVVGPRGPLVQGSGMEALYAAIPVCMPDGFSSCEEAGRSVVFAWLVPISAREASYVAEHGWDAFEDRLVDADPELMDLSRPSLLL